MPNSLRTALDSLARSFADGVLAAIRVASLEDLLAEGGSARPTRAGRARADVAPPAPRMGARKTAKKPLARRSPADVAKTLAQVVTLLKTKKAGLRSEEIQKALRVDKRALPRVLKDGLSKKALRSKGKKRATVYSVA